MTMTRRRRRSELNPANLSIPGLSTITDRRESSFARILFAVILFVCTSVCVNQTWERVSYYFTYPVTLEYEIKQLDKIEFPMVTMCFYYKNHSENEGLSLALAENVSLHGIWNQRGQNLEHVLKDCTYDTTKSCLGYWSTTLTTSGRCYTLRLADKIEYIGPASAIRLDLKTPTTGVKFGKKFQNRVSWKILIHEHAEEAVYGVGMDGHEIYQGTTTGMYYTHKRFLYKGTPNRPCYSKDVFASCILKCYDKTAVNKFNCSMPFMSLVDVGVPECTVQSKIVSDYLSNTAAFVRSSVEMCDYCGRPCVDDNFESQGDSRDEDDDGKANKSIAADSTATTTIFVLPTSEELEVLEEVEAYVLYALVCDIGGILGLYLGICILTFIEIVEFFVQRSFNFRPTIGKPYVRKFR